MHCTNVVDKDGDWGGAGLDPEGVTRPDPKGGRRALPACMGDGQGDPADVDPRALGEFDGKAYPFPQVTTDSGKLADWPTKPPTKWAHLQGEGPNREVQI